jgi:hypothetical protein
MSAARRLQTVSPSTRAKKAQAEVDAWNRQHQPGALVYLTKDDGTMHETRTTTNAQLLGGHSAVVWLFGFPGCWALHRVTAVAS